MAQIEQRVQQQVVALGDVRCFQLRGPRVKYTAISFSSEHLTTGSAITITILMKQYSNQICFYYLIPSQLSCAQTQGHSNTHFRTHLRIFALGHKKIRSSSFLPSNVVGMAPTYDIMMVSSYVHHHTTRLYHTFFHKIADTKYCYA